MDFSLLGLIDSGNLAYLLGLYFTVLTLYWTKRLDTAAPAAVSAPQYDADTVQLESARAA